MSEWIKITDKKPSNEKVGEFFQITYDSDDNGTFSTTIFKVIEHQYKLYLTPLNNEHNYPLISDPDIESSDPNLRWRYITENEMMAFL